MITKLLPLTENKLKILRFIYEQKETHLQEISKSLKIHPYSLQKTLKSIKPVLEERKAGKTILIKLNTKINGYIDLISIIEDYKLKTKNNELNLIIKNLQDILSQNNIITCLIFGSYARETATKTSDLDILLIVNKKNKEINKKLSQISRLFDKEINPLIFNQNEFNKALKIKEPALLSILEPPQRLIIKGKEHFLKMNQN